MRSIATIFMTALFLISCTSKMVYLAPAELSTISKETPVYFRTFDDQVVVLRSINISDDEIIGIDKSHVWQTLSLAKIRMAWCERVEAPYYIIAFVPVAIVGGLLLHGAETAPSPPPSECCPIIYSYDGDTYWLDAEPFGGSICEGLKRTDWCPLDYLQEYDCEYRVKIVNELDEDQYIDEVKLLAVEHPSNTQVFPDAQGEIHAVSNVIQPSYAVTCQGQDIKHHILHNDYSIWQSDLGTEKRLKDTLLIQFPKPADAREAKLLINCGTTLWGSHMGQKFIGLHGTEIEKWYAEIDRRGPAFTDVLQWYYSEETYLLAIRVMSGEEWEVSEMIYGAGPIATETRAYSIDVSHIPGDSLSIMLTPAVGFWQISYVAVDYSTGNDDISIVELDVVQAVTGAQKDVSTEIKHIDNNYLVMDSTGMYVDLVFPADEPQTHAARSLILKTTGYYKMHIDPHGAPETALIDRLNNEEGYTIKYAIQEYAKWKDKKHR